MKYILLILLPIIIFGTTMYVYFYLRQEQDKIIRKDQYDEARNEISKKGKKKTILDIRFVAPLGKPSSSEISVGLGLLSCITYILSTTIIDQEYLALISCIGTFAAIAGFFIGIFGILQKKNKSSAMKYGGVLLSGIGLGNIYFSFTFIFFGVFILLPYLFSLMLYVLAGSN